MQAMSGDAPRLLVSGPALLKWRADNLRQMRAFRCADAPKFFQQNRACSGVGLLVVQELIRPMRAHGNGVNLKRQASGIHFAFEMPRLLCFVHRARELANPLVHDGSDAVTHDAAPAIKLEAGRAEKTAAFK